MTAGELISKLEIYDESTQVEMKLNRVPGRAEIGSIDYESASDTIVLREATPPPRSKA